MCLRSEVLYCFTIRVEKSCNLLQSHWEMHTFSLSVLKNPELFILVLRKFVILYSLLLALRIYMLVYYLYWQIFCSLTILIEKIFYPLLLVLRKLVLYLIEKLRATDIKKIMHSFTHCNEKSNTLVLLVLRNLVLFSYHYYYYTFIIIIIVKIILAYQKTTDQIELAKYNS